MTTSLDDQDFRLLIELIDDEDARLDYKTDRTRIVSLDDLRRRLVALAWGLTP